MIVTLGFTHIEFNKHIWQHIIFCGPWPGLWALEWDATKKHLGRDVLVIRITAKTVLCVYTGYRIYNHTYLYTIDGIHIYCIYIYIHILNISSIVYMYVIIEICQYYLLCVYTWKLTWIEYPTMDTIVKWWLNVLHLFIASLFFRFNLYSINGSTKHRLLVLLGSNYIQWCINTQKQKHCDRPLRISLHNFCPLTMDTESALSELQNTWCWHLLTVRKLLRQQNQFILVRQKFPSLIG